MKIGHINYGDNNMYGDTCFFLEHSCDEWVIGDLEKAKKFRDDLSALIDKVESTPTK